MTVDEELSKLEENLRRLKIEYESYFNGGSPRPPNDLVFRVEKTIKKYGGGAVEMTFRQRFRFNQLTQSYAVHNDLWRKKLKIKEEGGTPGRREAASQEGAFRITWSDPEMELDKVDELLRAIMRARAAAGEPGNPIDPHRFAEFVRDKTRQCKQSLECDRVEFSVSVEGGRVKLRATKAE
ncbi:MAG: MXAN_5187 C-terminal domain-containing protein [Terriglobia bacterium]